MTANKILLLVLDGISDRPCPALGGLTPLSAAKKPVLDKLAAEGICGIMDTIAPGVRPGSDTAHLALLGYDPYKYYTGRGPLECVGTGIDMKAGMIGFRCNYATMNPQGQVSDRRAGRIHDTAALSQAVQDGVDLSKFGVKFIFRSGAGHRAALALEGEGLSHCVSSNDPKKEGVAPYMINAIRKGEKEDKTASVCNEFVKQSTKILFEHKVNKDRLAKGEKPANIILMRGAGEMGDFEPFGKKYGLNGSVIAAASLITGIGKAVSLPHIEVPGITGSQNSNIKGKIDAAISELKTRDFILMNIKGADESGHDGLAEQKKAFIEKIDPLLEPLLGLKDTVIIITGDHSTPCTIKDHSADPVPVIIRGDGVRMDDVVRYDEFSCAKGGLNRIRGVDILPIALDLINKSHKFGA